MEFMFDRLSDWVGLAGNLTVNWNNMAEGHLRLAFNCPCRLWESECLNSSPID